MPGPIPEQAARWFAALGAFVETAARTDRYVVPSSAGEPGIKLREGLLQVKARIATLGTERLAPGVEGTVETYRKWSFPVATDAPEPGDGWVDVTKKRRVRTFGRKAGEIVEVPKRPEAGCDVEVGEVQLGEGAWWTVCLEAFGPDEAARHRALRVTAAHVFSHDAPLLDAEHSTGYIGWLVSQ